MSRYWPGLSLCHATIKLHIYQLPLGLWVETWWMDSFLKIAPTAKPHITIYVLCEECIWFLKSLARCIIIIYNLLTNEASMLLPVLTFRTNHSQASLVRWCKYTIKPTTVPNREKHRKTWTMKRCQTYGSSWKAVSHGGVCTASTFAYFHFHSHVSSLTYVPLC